MLTLLTLLTLIGPVAGVLLIGAFLFAVGRAAAAERRRRWERQQERLRYGYCYQRSRR